MPPSHPFQTSVRPLCVEASAQRYGGNLASNGTRFQFQYARTGHCSPPKSAHATKNFLSVSKSVQNPGNQNKETLLCRPAQSGLGQVGGHRPSQS